MNLYDLSRSEIDDDLRLLRARLVKAGAFLVAITMFGTVGYRIIAPSETWLNAFYMTAITLTTVGFGEVIDLSTNPGGRFFTSVLILVGMGGVLYFVSTATAFVVEGQLGNVLRRRQMEKTIQDLRGHVIVCGSGATAIYTARELLTVRRSVLVVCESRDGAEEMSRELPEVPVIVGDPSADDVLHAAGLDVAAGLVACTDNDRDNLVITLSARQISGSARIVAQVTHVDSADKIRQVGADAVVSPSHIGGLRLASELIRPTVVSFLDVMLRDRDRNVRVDEVRLPAGSPSVGKTVAALELDGASNALLMACREPSGRWQYNPKPDYVLGEDVVLILLGTPPDTIAVCEATGGQMIAPPKPDGA